MNVVDSCGWLEYFSAGPNTEFFRPALEDLPRLIVPSITVYEVCKRMFQQVGEAQAQEALVFLQKGRVVNLSPADLFAASKFSALNKVAMADAIIWQTAQAFKATLYTQDVDLNGLAGVVYRGKPV